MGTLDEGGWAVGCIKMSRHLGDWALQDVREDCSSLLLAWYLCQTLSLTFSPAPELNPKQQVIYTTHYRFDCSVADSPTLAQNQRPADAML